MYQIVTDSGTFFFDRALSLWLTWFNFDRYLSLWLLKLDLELCQWNVKSRRRFYLILLCLLGE